MLAFSPVRHVKTYAHNSPLRVGLLWLGAHLLFLSVGLYGHARNVNLNDGEAWATVIGLMVFLFPIFNMVLSAFFGLLMPFFGIMGIVFVISYYTLYAYVVVQAQDTSSKKFKTAHTIFLIWFLTSLGTGLVAVFG